MHHAESSRLCDILLILVKTPSKNGLKIILLNCYHELVWCLKSKHQIIELAARATDARMVSALLCHTKGLGFSL